MAASLFAFGVGKTVLVEAGGEEAEAQGEGGDREKRGWGKAVRGGVEMVIVGGVAAAAAMGIMQVLG